MNKLTQPSPNHPVRRDTITELDSNMQIVHRHANGPARRTTDAPWGQWSMRACSVKRALVRATLVASLGLLFGCAATERAVQEGGGTARSFVGSLEPTGMVQDTRERTELMKSLRNLSNSLDANAFNQSVTQIGVAATKLSERIEAIPVDDLRQTALDLSTTAGALRTQIDAARLDESSASVRSLADTTTKQLSTLDIDTVNSVLADLNNATTQLSAAIEQLRNDTSKTLVHVSDLTVQLDDVVRATPVSELAGRIDEAVNTINTTAARLPETTAKLGSALSTIRFGSQVAIGVLFILGACLLAWLLRLLRPQRA